MSQDLRLYTLSLAIMLMLWVAPVRADYGNTTCPVLAVPVQLSGNDIWASYDEDENVTEDYRGLYPSVGSTLSVNSGSIEDIESCSFDIGSGEYYDGANHLWVLDSDLTCDFVWGDQGNVRGGDINEY